MDSLPHLLSILGLLALLLHFYSKRIKSYSTDHEASKSSRVRAPEPSWALPLIGHLHLLGGKVSLARTLGAMADKHGPILSVRLGSHRALLVSSCEFAKECFTTKDVIFASRPVMAVSKYLFYDQAVFSLAPYGPYWREVRKIVTLELMTNHRLQKLRHVRESEVDFCTKDLHLLCTKNGDLPTQVAMNEWFEYLTCNIIMRTLAGKRFSTSTCDNSDTEEGHLKEAIKKALYLFGIFVVSDAIPWLERMDIGGHVKSMKQTHREVDAVLGRWLEEHVQKRMENDNNGGEADPDFIDVMLSVLAEDTLMSGHNRDTIIKATTLSLILGGSESTADTLTWALCLLLNNKQVLKTAQDELDTQVGRDRLVQESDIKNLKYLQAIVKETLRLYPAGPLAGPREATEDCTIGGYYVPKGTRLIVNLWKVQRDPRMWLEPDEFKPERFLVDHVDIGFRGQQFEYLPFSSGRRMCPGVTFGLQVLHLALARLIHGFDLKTPLDDPVDMTEGLGIALPKLHPLEVLIKPRLPTPVYGC